MSIKSVNPFSGEVIKKFPEHTPKETEQKIQTALMDLEMWKSGGFSHRARQVKALAQILYHEKERYARLITMEMGKPLKESVKEIEKSISVCHYYADNAPLFLKNEFIETENGKGSVVYEPLGIVLAVMPWNFPLWQVFRFAIPAVMAGNVCLLKHASNVPQCAIAVEELFRKAQFPEGIFQTLLIKADKVKDLIADDRINAITLTGSEKAGSQVASIAGKHIKKTVLELGGSDPFIVLEDANLKNATDVAVKSRMINSGQSCINAKRFIIMQSIAGQFINMLKEKVEQLKIGDPMDDSTDIGPLAKEELVKTALKQIKQSVQKGAKIISGEIKPKGSLMKPVILTDITPGMRCFDEEVFAPVFSITVVKNQEEAIRLANQSRYGLASSVWTEDPDKANQIAKKIQAGSVFINALPRSDIHLPFGGTKKSGYGKELSHHGIREFVNAKTIYTG